VVVVLGAASLIGLSQIYAEKEPQWKDVIDVKQIGSAEDVTGSWALAGKWNGYMGTALQLKDGRYRYWFYSDFKGADEPKYPLEGIYRAKGGALVLDPPPGGNGERYVWGVYQGVEGLWADSSLAVLITRQEKPDVRMLQRISYEVDPKAPVYNAQRKMVPEQTPVPSAASDRGSS